MQTIKCVVVGDRFRSMKTEMLVAYTTNKYPTEYIPTVFDNYAVTVMIGEEPYTLGLFDTSGQEEYPWKLRSISYPETNVFLICFSIGSPASFESVKEMWFPELHHFCPRVPCLIVGTQSELRNDPATIEECANWNTKPITFSQGEKLARELGAVRYLECSAHDQKSLKIVFDQAMIAALAPRDPPKKSIFQPFFRRFIASPSKNKEDPTISLGSGVLNDGQQSNPRPTPVPTLAPTPTPAPIPTPAPSLQGAELIRAGDSVGCLFDFDGQSGELSFQEGDVILVKEVYQDGWAYGHLDGTEGLFPSNYVEKLKESDVEKPARPLASADGVIPERKIQEVTSTSAVMNAVGLLSLEDQVSSTSGSTAAPPTPGPSPSLPSATTLLVEGLLAKVKDNERRLMANERSIGKKTTEAKEELNRQFQERIAEMKKEGEVQSKQMMEEVKRMREEMMKAHDEQSKKELEERLKKVEEEQRALRKNFDETEEIMREQQHITKSESHLSFYRSIQNKLQQVFLGCQVVASGTKATSLSSAKMLEIAGGSVPLPANNLLGDLAVSTSPPSTTSSSTPAPSGGKVTAKAMKELDRLTEFVGRRLALMYGEQLDFIGTESAWLLGECAAKEMIGFLWTNNPLITSGASEGRQGGSFVGAVGMQLIGAVSAIESEEESGTTKEKKIWEKMSGARVSMNEPWRFRTKIMTSTQEEWDSDGIFHRAGILVEKDDGKKLWYSGGPTNPEMYGYRRGSDDEVKRDSRLKQTRERVSTQVKESQVFQEGSKAAKKHYDNVAAVAQGSKEEVELLRRQMQQMQSQMERQNQEWTSFVAAGTSNSASSSPAKNWKHGEVSSWFERQGQSQLSAIVQEQALDGMILFGLYSARESAGYRNDCAELGIAGLQLQLKFKGLLVLLFEGAL